MMWMAVGGSAGLADASCEAASRQKRTVMTAEQQQGGVAWEPAARHTAGRSPAHCLGATPSLQPTPAVGAQNK